MKKWIIFTLVFFILLSCNKNTGTSIFTGIQSSLDTLRFDTVFTTTGSVTKFLKIYNNNNHSVSIEHLQLSGGTSSNFYINVDGLPGHQFSGLELEANDSLYIFVAVKFDPTANNLPFILRDSILISQNGKQQKIQLEAWGQNAHFLRSQIIQGQQVWTPEKPYVILGSLEIASGATLNIQEGCKIYTHADAPIIVNGALIADGGITDNKKIVFQGDRLDLPYRDYPASWPGIYFNAGSTGNRLRNTVIKNAYQGIVCEGDANSPQTKLSLFETVIDNCYDVGVLAINSNIKAENLLVSNCGKNLTFAYGGNYNFNHCTSIAYSNEFILHKNPSLLVTDYLKENGNILTAPMNCVFVNSIFWGNNGSVENEIATDRLGTKVFAVSFDHCLLKYKQSPANITTNAITENQDPLFDSVNIGKRFFDFHLKSLSPAVNKGVTSNVIKDLDNKSRPKGLPDLGCYELQ